MGVRHRNERSTGTGTRSQCQLAPAVLTWVIWHNVPHESCEQDCGRLEPDGFRRGTGFPNPMHWHEAPPAYELRYTVREAAPPTGVSVAVGAGGRLR